MFFGKKNIINNFYSSLEGARIIYYAELFLDELNFQIENDMIKDFTRDCKYYREDYEYQLIFSKLHFDIIQFVIYSRKERRVLLTLEYNIITQFFSPTKSLIFHKHRNQTLTFYATNYDFFNHIMERIYLISNLRNRRIHLSKDPIRDMKYISISSRQNNLKGVRNFLNEHKKKVRKDTFANITHIIKTLEETVRINERLKQKEMNSGFEKVREKFENMITIELSSTLSNYFLFEQISEEKLLILMNRFYLKALDVQQFNDSPH